MTVRDIIRVIEEDGWRIARQKGSHRQDQHESKRGVVTIPGTQAMKWTLERLPAFTGRRR